MKRLKRLTKCGMCLAVLAGLVFKTGCGLNGDFLGLEDYQRDLLGLGGLAAWLVLNPPPPADAGDGGAGQPVPGPDGTQGIPGADGADGEDGPPGSAGAAGADGQAGAPGANGLTCWDLNGNGVADLATEDTNADGVVNVLDCRGADGPSGGAGPAGSQGAAGAPGSNFFSIFIDDFFGPRPVTVTGSLTVTDRPNAIRIEEPTLGAVERLGGIPGELAYRVGIPNLYDAGNAVTMRLFFDVTGTSNGKCLVFTVDRARLRTGQTVEQYDDTRYVRVDLPSSVIVGSAAGGQGAGSSAVIVDLPLNVGTLNETTGRWDGGLGFWVDDLRVTDFLAFELTTHADDARVYHMIGVDFFETDAPQVSAATIFDAADIVTCVDGVDCNSNDVPDDVDIAVGKSFDCDENGVPDDCEDCNENGIPDECDIACESETCLSCDQPLELRGDGIGCFSRDTNGDGIPDECQDIESLAGWWRFVFQAEQACEPDIFQDYTNEVRYLLFDENNNLVENRISNAGSLDDTIGTGIEEICLRIDYPSDNGPNYAEFRFDSTFTPDTHREITASSFDPITGVMSIEELVDVPQRMCIGEEGTTVFGGEVSGDTILGTWEFQMTPESGFFGECLSRMSNLCGTFGATRMPGPPTCTIVQP